MTRDDYDRAVSIAKSYLAGHAVAASDFTEISEALVAVAAHADTGMTFMTYSERRAHTTTLRKMARDIGARLADQAIEASDG